MNAFKKEKNKEQKSVWNVLHSIMLYGPDVSICTVSGMLAGLHTITCQYLVVAIWQLSRYETATHDSMWYICSQHISM